MTIPFSTGTSLISDDTLISATKGREHFNPNLLGHQWAWDSTSLGEFKTCARKYYYTTILGLRSRREALPLKFGIHYHAGLEYYDRMRFAGAEHEEALKAAVKAVAIDMGRYKEAVDQDGKPCRGEFIGPWISDDTKRTMYTCLRSIVWYLDHFKDDPMKTAMLANGKPAVELSFRFELPHLQAFQGQPYMLCGHLDRVVEYQGDAYNMDRKTTTSQIDQRYYERYSPDNQMSLYTLATKIVFELPAKGVIIDAAQVAVGFTRYHRGFVHRTPIQIEEWVSDLDYWLALSKDMAEKRKWPMNDKACGMYGGCSFQGICSRDPSVRHSFLQQSFEQKPWDPLVSRG